MLFHTLLFFAQLPFAQAEPTTDDLATKAKENGVITTTTSTKTDPVGIEGLFGMEGSFIVDSSCRIAFTALADIPAYPTHSSAVKKVEVLEQTDNTLKTNYTEGAFGFEVTSQLLWTFAPDDTPPSITSITVGENDSPSWAQLKFEDTESPTYCRIHIRTYADMSIIPGFLMEWMKDKASEELVTTYRGIITGHQKDASK